MSLFYLPRIFKALSLPPVWYDLASSLPKETVSSGKLSGLQLEGILYAVSRHSVILLFLSIFYIIPSCFVKILMKALFFEDLLKKYLYMYMNHQLSHLQNGIINVQKFI